VAGLALALAVPSAAIASTVGVHASPSTRPHHDGAGSSGTELAGTVVSVGVGSVVIQDGDGFWRTVVLGPATTYSEGPMKMAPAATSTDVAVGAMVRVSGTVDPNHTSLDAGSVQIELTSVRGIIQSVTTTAIVISEAGSSTQETVDVNPQTVVFTQGGIVTLASAVQGAVVEAFGLPQSDGSLLALYLRVGQGHQDFGHGWSYGFSVPNRVGPNHFRGFGDHQQ
jgi:hypothetical protein